MAQIYLIPTYQDRKSRLISLKKFKIFCLVIVLITSCIAIIISLSNTLPKNRSKYQLPSQISMAKWQLNSTNNLPKALQNGALSARQYLYSSSLQSDFRYDLRIDALYINRVVSIPKSLDIIGLKYPSNNSRIHYLDKVGYYALFFDQERAYLSSCINSYGFTTVTEDQFIYYRPLDLSFSHISAYLIGTRDLFDSRCLLSTLSIPLGKNTMAELQKNSIEKKAQILEKAWIEWHQNWKDYFPIN